jgi:hypothetical protein
MPNPVIRSAVFPAIKSKDRQWLKREKIAALNGVEIIYSGQQCNQQDLTLRRKCSISREGTRSVLSAQGQSLLPCAIFSVFRGFE